jgi:small subunit ribosomal protein S17
MEIRGRRKSLVGLVQGRTGEKSIKVAYFYKRPHGLYRKEVKRKTVLHVHDEDNLCQVGDRVKIMATRPLSRMKRWRVTQVVEKAVRA